MATTVTVPSVKRIALIGGFAYPVAPAKELHDCLQALADNATALDYKASCRIATAAALPAYTRVANVITANANGALNGDPSVDGVTLAVGNRVLLKNGAAGADNGIYTVTALGGASAKWKLTRAEDANTSALVTSGLYTEIEEGTANTGTAWWLTTANPITLNTTSLTFTQFAGAINRTDGTIANVGTQAAGTSNKVAAADHVHAHGAQALGDGTNHAVATTAFAGFQSATDKGKQDHARQYTGATVAGAALTGGGTYTAYFHRADAAETVTAAHIVCTGTPSTQPAASPNDLVINVKKGATVVATKTYATNMPAAGTWDALTLSGTPADLDLASGDSLTLEIVQNGTARLGPLSGLNLQIAAISKA